MKALYFSTFIILSTIQLRAQEIQQSTNNLDTIAPGLSEHVDIFTSGTNNTHTFRIPSLVTAPNGDLIAAIDARRDNSRDLIWVRNIDIVIKRSSNNGTSWGPMEVVADFPDGEAASDPSMIVNKITGEIFLFYNYMNQDTAPKIFYLHVIKSKDNGKTWSKHQDITSQITRPEWYKDFKFITSGRGIQLGNGGLRHCMVNLESGLHLFGSDDHGKTWFFKDLPIKPANESKVIELMDGSLMINARQNGSGSRQIHISRDEGNSWKSYNDTILVDPGCNGSIIRYTSIEHGFSKNRLLFSNAKSEKGRKNLNVRISYDEGKTWSEGKTINPGSSAYSSLTILNDGSIGVFYEANNHRENRFARFTLDWLTDGADKLLIPYKIK